MLLHHRTTHFGRWLLALMLAIGIMWGWTAQMAYAAGNFVVNSSADNTAPDNFLTIREALLVARGSFTMVSFTPAEQAQLGGCTFSSSGVLTGGCGAGIADTITFNLSASTTIALIAPLPGIDDTAPTRVDANLTLGLTIDAAGIGGVNDALTLQSNGNFVRDIAIVRSPRDGMHIIGNNNEVVSVEVRDNARRGVYINGGDNNVISESLIGNFVPGPTLPCSTGNRESGVYLSNGASGNTIEANTVVCNARDGITIEGSGSDYNRVVNNGIGTQRGVSPVRAHPNNFGVAIFGGAKNNIVGQATTLPQGNTISGNTNFGVYLLGTGTTGNTVEGNLIGEAVDTAGTAVALPNFSGVVIEAGAMANTVRINVIASNTNVGAHVRGTGTMGNNLYGNTIRNQGNTGVQVDGGATQTVVGGNRELGLGNVIVANVREGIYISGAETRTNYVLGNRVGTEDGITARGNGLNGIVLDNGTQGNLIGSGIDVRARNLVSGNGEYGLVLDRGATGNIVSNNYIGTNAVGDAALPNGLEGVLARNAALENELSFNLVSGNLSSGIGLNNVAGTLIRGNRIGTNADGTMAIPNRFGGIILVNGATDTRIGTGTADDRNLISGNGNNGVLIFGSGTSNNVVAANFIGLNAAGTAALPNQVNGISVVDGSNNRIEDAGMTECTQFISGNNAAGVAIDNASGTLIGGGTCIGVPATGVAAVGNMGPGVLLDRASNTLVRVPLVRNNGGAGIVVVGTGADQNYFDVASVAANSGLPIDLNDDGATPNDPDDSDSGPNQLLNYPVVTSFTTDAVGGTACANCRVAMYEAIGDPRAAGGGGTFLSATTADGSGNWSLVSPTTPSGMLTFTASVVSGMGGTTSEFSPAVAISDAATATPTNTATSNATPTDTAVPVSSPTATGTIMSDSSPTATGTVASSSPTATSTVTPGSSPTPTTGPTGNKLYLPVVAR